MLYGVQNRKILPKSIVPNSSTVIPSSVTLGPSLVILTLDPFGRAQDKLREGEESQTSTQDKSHEESYWVYTALRRDSSVAVFPQNDRGAVSARARSPFVCHSFFGLSF
jgi:hypothetical protein